MDGLESGLQCRFCVAQVASVAEAAEEGWVPDYWDGDANVDGPVCPECAATMLRFNDEHGDHELAGRIVVQGGEQ